MKNIILVTTIGTVLFMSGCSKSKPSEEECGKEIAAIVKKGYAETIDEFNDWKKNCAEYFTEDAMKQNHSIVSMQKNNYDMYMGVDSIGRDILDLTGADIATQISVWNKSKLKKEYLELFPDFGEMKSFVKDRIKGEPLVTKLLVPLSDMEDKFYSGKINSEDAKKELSLSK